MDSTFVITPEEKLILYCAGTKLDAIIEDKIYSIVISLSDWDYVLQMADRHRLKHFLYYHLNQICPESIPEDVMVSLKNYYAANVQRNLLMFGNLLNILDIFKLRGIESLPYKGPILALETYHNLGLRKFDDLDIFVHKEDVSKVKKILKSINYEPTINLNLKEEKKFIKTMRDYIFYNVEKGITLEIHWRFPSIFFFLPNPDELFDWNNCRTIEIHSKQILVPSPEEMFLILCIHNAEHRWRRISLLCDFKEFINAHEVDWVIIIEKSKKLGIQRLVGINFYLACFLLSLEIPENISKELMTDKDIKKISVIIISKMFSKDNRSIQLSKEMGMSYKLRENKFYGIRDVFRGLFSPGILEWKNVRLPVVLLQLYYLLRPFLLIKRYILNNRK
jgi:hypothetical protein